MEKIIKEILQVAFLTLGVVWALFCFVFFTQVFIVNQTPLSKLSSPFGITLVIIFFLSIVLILSATQIKTRKK